ncbi:MAG: hypothetical protein A2857_04760 [Candidatus Levybacteria bacterium RIFCSPHIGHO2_01_FULL_36_15]|nr:MAG: hypothetical protein A2857_04760 [Candidatus Levybacteria bacterium RIFCSPHIGHO2_01_FULL_36_15]
MKKNKNIFKKVEEFTYHRLPLLFSLPPGEEFSETHESIISSNLLIVKNKHGYTRIYSMGVELLLDEEINKILYKDKIR